MSIWVRFILLPPKAEDHVVAHIEGGEDENRVQHCGVLVECECNITLYLIESSPDCNRYVTDFLVNGQGRPLSGRAGWPVSARSTIFSPIARFLIKYLSIK